MNEMNAINKPDDPIMGAYEEWKSSKSEESTGKLLSALDGQIGTALHTFAGGMEGHLKLRAQTMTLKAAETYDPKKGMHLKSYVYQQLQPLQREYGKRVNAVKLPERQLLDRRTLDRMELEFEEKHGRQPSTAELADYTSIPVKRIASIRANKPQVVESRTLDPITSDSVNTVQENMEEVWGDYVYGSLGATDQRIYEMLTGYAGAKTYPKGEIARRLKISPAAVSQRINKISSMLEEGLNLDRQ